MTESTEELWKRLWGYRNWLITIALADFRNIVHGDHGKAGDLADESLFRAAKNIKRLRDRRRIKPWLRAILRNTALDLHRGQKALSNGFADWLRSTQQGEERNEAFRYFAFLSLLQLSATKRERAYIAALKKNAATKKVTNLPKNRAVQLLKKRLHASGADYAAAQTKMADRASAMMAEMETVVKEITADIAAHFRKTVRSVQYSDEQVWEWCCAIVIAAMREGMAEVGREEENRGVDKTSREIFSYVLESVMAQSLADAPEPAPKPTKQNRTPKKTNIGGRLTRSGRTGRSEPN